MGLNALFSKRFSVAILQMKHTLRLFGACSLNPFNFRALYRFHRVALILNEPALLRLHPDNALVQRDHLRPQLAIAQERSSLIQISVHTSSQWLQLPGSELHQLFNSQPIEVSSHLDALIHLLKGYGDLKLASPTFHLRQPSF